MSDIIEMSVAQDRIRDALNDALGLSREKLRRALSTATRDLSRLAASLAPVGETHRLARSLERVTLLETPTSMTGRVGPAAFYGMVLEKGVTERTITVRARATAGLIKKPTYQRRFALAARPFAAPALDALRSPIQALVLHALDEAAQEANRGA